jgi:hypothetical protein
VTPCTPRGHGSGARLAAAHGPWEAAARLSTSVPSTSQMTADELRRKVFWLRAWDDPSGATPGGGAIMLTLSSTEAAVGRWTEGSRIARCSRETKSRCHLPPLL